MAIVGETMLLSALIIGKVSADSVCRFVLVSLLRQDGFHKFPLVIRFTVLCQMA